MNSEYNYLIKCDKHRFIFGETPKTACTSMKMVLLPLIRPFNLRLRMRHYMGRRRFQKIAPETIVKDIKEYPGYFKFSFVRNPFDRLVSAYKWGMHGWVNSKEETFESFVKSLMKGGRREIKNLSNQKANHVVPWTTLFNIKDFDFIGRFENINDDWNHICKKIGIRKNLPITNKTKHKHYRDYYNEETRKFVTRFYENDLNVFNYKF